MAKPHRIALLLTQEISAVVTAMRQNSKWALIPTRYTRLQDDELGDDPLLDELKKLRRYIFHWHDWSVVDPMKYLEPFLDVISSPETSGPITGVALTSLCRMLDHFIMGEWVGSLSGVMHRTADAVTQCKFEATDRHSDEVVLFKILQVLLACMRCPGGKLLTNDNVINIFQACFRIGHYQTERSKDMSELLTQASRQIMVEMVAIIFSRLGDLPALDLSAEETHSLAHSPRLAVKGQGIGRRWAAIKTHVLKRQMPWFSQSETPCTKGGASKRRVVVNLVPCLRCCVVEGVGQHIQTERVGCQVSPHGTVGQHHAPFAATRPPVNPADQAEGDPAATADPSGPNNCALVVENGAETAIGVVEDAVVARDEQITEAVAGALAAEDDTAKSELEKVSIVEDAGHVTSVPAPLRSKSLKGGEDEHGLESVIEVLGFIISLINSDGDQGVHADLNVFGLELMNVALNSGGPAFERHEAIMALLREEVWRALLAAGRSHNLAALSGASQVALSLYVHLGRALLLQLEAFLDLTLLQTAGGRSAPRVEHQEAALEGILDLCNQAGFIRDVYINLDCRIERSNMFESITGLLSKAAFPVNCPLAPVHLLALNALYSILCALSDGCTGMSPWDGDEAEDNPKDLAAVWVARCCGSPPPILDMRSRGRPLEFESSGGGMESPKTKARAQANELRRCAAETALLEKHLKTKLAVAADHFNRDYRKGFQYLQSLGLLEAEPDPAAVARFLRCCPGLSKQTIGELLGENDDFFLAVLDEFTQTFDFTGLGFDMAIRMYLESFRLPGEAQKINRIMETFGKRYHEQCPDLFHNTDVVYVLGYSVIMLNTDQHNVQVKKKMTVDEFIRNNRGINGGEDLPQDFLRDLYHSISRNEIRISTESQAFAAASPVLWAEIKQQSEAPRGVRLDTLGLSTPRVDREMFSLMWGPTVAAVSVVLDHAEDVIVVRQALETLQLAAKIAAFHHVDEVMDSLVISLSKFTSVLNPSSPKPALAFGENDKMRMATEAVFALSSRYGDSLHSGWRNILDIVIRLHKLNLLPPSVLIMESEDPEAARQRLPRAPASRRVVSAGSMFSRAFSSPEAGEEASSREMAAMQRTLQCIAQCRIDEMFADSKFLRAESLTELVKAIMMAPGPVSRIAASGEDSDTAEVCLELVIAVALRNRDRILLIWPLVHDYLAAIMAPEGTRQASPLVARAALGLLRVCQRLLPYKEDTAEGLLKSLHLVLRLNPSVAWDLASRIAAEVLALVKASGTHIQSVRGWRTVTALISMTALHPEAAPLAFDALSAMVRADTLSPAAFQPALDTAFHFAERHSKDPTPDRSCEALDLVETQFAWLLLWDKDHTLDGGAGLPTAGVSAFSGGASLQGPTTPRSVIPTTAAEMWFPIVMGLAKFGYDPNPGLRTHALVILHRVLSSSDALMLGGVLWVRVLDEAITPMLGQLAVMVSRSPRDSKHGDADKSLRMGVVLETKVVLQYMDVLLPEPTFAALWGRVLQVLQDCTKNHSEEAAEAVPEAIKNMLLVLAAQGVLNPEWKDPEGNSLWDMTWSKVRTISSGLTPQILAAPLMAAEEAAATARSPTDASPLMPPVAPGDAGSQTAGLHEGAVLPDTQPGGTQGLPSETAAATPVPSADKLTGDAEGRIPADIPVHLPDVEGVSVETGASAPHPVTAETTEGQHPITDHSTLRGADLGPGSVTRPQDLGLAHPRPAASSGPADAGDVAVPAGEVQGLQGVGQSGFISGVAPPESGAMAHESDKALGREPISGAAQELSGKAIAVETVHVPLVGEVANEGLPPAHFTAETLSDPCSPSGAASGPDAPGLIDHSADEPASDTASQEVHSAHVGRAAPDPPSSTEIPQTGTHGEEPLRVEEPGETPVTQPTHGRSAEDQASTGNVAALAGQEGDDRQELLGPGAEAVAREGEGVLAQAGKMGVAQVDAPSTEEQDVDSGEAQVSQAGTTCRQS